jgi:hypothetical protein
MNANLVTRVLEVSATLSFSPRLLPLTRLVRWVIRLWVEVLVLEFGRYGYTGCLAGPARGPAMGTKEVKGERWRPAKAPARPADRH